ncbi:MAG: FtsQ-type POTRA domain-containing protein [Solirubrobacterales bacterium]|nr:FtsQ-type POTRA domain-containing protein [Solirubrobacterales bacterium]
MMVKRRRRVRLRLVVAVAGVLALLAGGWLWLRDSPLVAVRKVDITGVSGPDADQIRAALTVAARNMTTLDVRVGQLRTAVAPYPVVRDVRVGTRFPHGMRIQVVEHLAVGALAAGGRTIAASGDGTVLHDVPTGGLPVIPVTVLPAGVQVVDGPARQALALLAATPRRLLSRVAQVTTSPPHGLVVQVRSGPEIYFGDSSDLAAKWGAAAAVLADPSSAGASYIDVTDPARPAAGVSQQAVVAAGLGTGGSPSTTTGSTGPTSSTAGG